MKIPSWNVQGVENSRATRSLRYVILKHIPDVVFLSEIKSSSAVAEKIKKKVGYNNSIISESSRNSGGLMLMWQNHLNISMNSFSKGHINVTIKEPDWWWRFSGFYGNPDQRKRRESWHLLERLHDNIKLPWIRGGDFNEIMFSKEKKKGTS